MKYIKKIILLLVIITGINTYALEMCTPSDEYIEYMNLPEEERKNLIPPDYCKEIQDVKKQEKLRGSSTQSRYFAKDENLVTSIKDQGANGTCWSFSAIAAVETNALKNGLGTYDLSESHLLYSLMSNGYSDSVGKSGKYIGENFDEGGKLTYAPTYFYNGIGQLTENEWKYPTYPNKLPVITSSQYKQGRKILSVGNYTYENPGNNYVACKSDEITNIKENIIENGSVVGTMYLDEYLLDSTKDYYISSSSDSEGANHAILIVGWDDNISKSKFKNATRNGAWIIKNSFGATWSDDGYFYVSYDDAFICKNIATYGDVSTKTYDYTYNASDVVGDLSLTFRDRNYIASKFNKISTKNEKLKRISFAVGSNMSYNVYVSLSNNLNSKDDWQLVGSGTSAEYAIKSIDISKDILITNTYTVIVEYKSPGSTSVPMFVMCDFLPETAKMTYTRGRNFYTTNISEWQDLANLNLAGETTKCEPNIYAYTDVIDTSSTVYAKSITLDKPNAKIIKDNTIKLNVTFNPTNVTYKTITWKSSNEKVAKVDGNGNVTGLNYGTATITASTANGKIATSKIEVVDKLTSGWETISGAKYYYENGEKITGFREIDGKLYFFSRINGKLKYGWQNANEGYWYQNSNGEVVKGLQKIQNNKYYFDETTGIMYKGFKEIDGKLYFFSRLDGKLKYGWQNTNEGYWYQNSNGEVVRGLKTVGGDTYYFDDTTGIMYKGFKEIDGKLYFFSRVNGKLKYGWQNASEGSWYQRSTGEVVRGLQTIQGDKYYFDDTTGIMYKGFKEIDGKLYFFSRVNGKLKYGWQNASEGYWYQNKDGEVLKGLQTIDGRTYKLNNSTGLVEGFKKNNNKLYYYNPDGTQAKGVQYMMGRFWLFNSKTGVFEKFVM